MDLVEGISNEVLFAFIVTNLLIIVALFYTFVLDRADTSLGQVNQTRSTQSVDGGQPEARDVGIFPDRTINNDNSIGPTATSSDDNNLPPGGDSTDPLERTPQGDVREEDSVRRRVVNDSRQSDQVAEGQDETMLVKVKHNETIQEFNVSKNSTVIELKRMAFNDELNAGRRVRFVYAGQLLRNDNDLLTRYGVLPNTVVHCVITDQPAQTASTPGNSHDEADLDLSRLMIPLLTVALIMAWYGLISYRHIFTGSSIAILMFLTSLYVILVYVTTLQ